MEGRVPSALAPPGPSTERMSKFTGSMETSNLQTSRVALKFVERWVMSMPECLMVILGCSGSERKKGCKIAGPSQGSQVLSIVRM